MSVLGELVEAARDVAFGAVTAEALARLRDAVEEYELGGVGRSAGSDDDEEDAEDDDDSPDEEG